MEIDDRITLEISIGSLASLIAGWYVMSSSVNINAIPSEVFIELAKKLVPYLKDWDYDKLTIEEWITNNLLIIPHILAEETDKDSDIYFEYPNGNVLLVVCGNFER